MTHLKDLMISPNEANKFKDKNNKLDLRAITKYSYEKIGFSENEQNELVENYMNILNHPKIEELAKYISKDNNPNK